MRLLRWAYGAAHGVVAVSDGVANDRSLTSDSRLPRYTPSTTQSLTNNYSISLRLRSKTRKFGLETQHVLLAVGRLIDVKDYPTQLRALALLRRTEDAGLSILGEGPERQALERMVVELGLDRFVRMPGFVANPFAYMARASVYVLSSVREGLPGAMIRHWRAAVLSCQRTARADRLRCWRTARSARWFR